MKKNLVALKPGMIFLNSLGLMLDTPEDIENLDSIDILDENEEKVGSMDLTSWPFFKIETNSMLGKIKTSYICDNPTMINSELGLIGSFDINLYQTNSVDYEKKYKFNVWMDRNQNVWCNAECLAYQMFYKEPNWRLFLNNGRDVVLFQQNDPKKIDKKLAEIRFSCKKGVPSDTYLIHSFYKNWQDTPDTNVKVTAQAYAIAEKMGVIPAKELKYTKAVRKDNIEEAHGEYIATPDLNAREVFMLAAQKLQEIDPSLSQDFKHIQDNMFGPWLKNLLGLCYETYSDEEIETIFGIKPNRFYFQDGSNSLREVMATESIGQTKVYVPRKK